MKTFYILMVCLGAIVCQISCKSLQQQKKDRVAVALQYLGHSIKKLGETAIQPKDDVGMNITACLNDTKFLSVEPLKSCQKYLINYNWTTTSHADTVRFCKDGCPSKEEYLLRHLVPDCGLPPDQIPDEATFREMKGMCGKSPKGLYCAEAWIVLSHLNASYAQCVSNYSGHGTCPTDCQKGEAWVKENLGCCYRVLLDFIVAKGLQTSGFLTSPYWTSCHNVEPTTCKV